MNKCEQTGIQQCVAHIHEKSNTIGTKMDAPLSLNGFNQFGIPRQKIEFYDGLTGSHEAILASANLLGVVYLS